MSRSVTPEVATTRIMARTLATFYGFGGAAGLLVTLDIDPGSRRAILTVLSCLALGAAVVVGRWGRAGRGPTCTPPSVLPRR